MLEDKVKRVYIPFEQHSKLASAWLDRRIAAFATLKLAQARAARYADEREEEIRWELELQYLHETGWQGTTGGDYTHITVSTELRG